MSAEEENELIAFKSVSGNWDLTEITQKAHLISTKDKIAVGSADVAAFLSKYPSNVVDRNWENSTRLLRQRRNG